MRSKQLAFSNYQLATESLPITNPQSPITSSRRSVSFNSFVTFTFALLALLSSVVYLYTPNTRVQAATNNTINFQARLLTNTGALIPDGNYHVEFKIYDSVSSGSSAQGVCSGNSSTDDCWWLETRSTGNLVTVKNGYVTASLGSVTSFPANMPWDQELWLSMNIGGNGGSASWDGEMSPRMKITAVPFAQAANKLQNTSSGITSKLTLANPTVGDQNFVIQDQGAAGTFNLCIQNSTACGFALLGGANTFTGVNTFSAAGTALQVSNNATIGGTLGVTGLTTATGGLTVGTGSNFINQGSTLFTALAISDVAGGGNIGTAAATVDAYTVFNVAQTTAGQTLTLPSPTNTTAGRMAFVNNTGSASFNMYGSVIAANKSNAFIWNGTAWVTTVSLSGSVVNTIGTLDSVTKSADGASIAANAIYLQTADATYPGLVSTGTQTFAGNKTFSGTLTVNNYATFQNATDSTTALQVKNAAGIDLLSIDTATVNNLITNSGFEINTNGWSVLGSSSIVRDTSYYNNGIASLAITSTALANDGAKFDYNLTNSTTYTLSFYARLASGSMNTLQAGRSDNGSTQTTCTLSPSGTLSNSGWKRFACSFTTGTTSGTPFIFIRQSDATARTIYIDSVQLESGSIASTYKGAGQLGINAVINQPLMIQSLQDTSEAFRISSSAGTSLFNVDTQNQAVTVGKAINSLYHSSFSVYGQMNSSNPSLWTGANGSGPCSNSNTCLYGLDGGGTRLAVSIVGALAGNNAYFGGTGVGLPYSAKIQSSAANVGLIIQSASTQTADKLQFTDSNDAIQTKFDANGQLTSYGTNTNLLGLATPAFTTSSSGTSYYYKITATNAQGETVGSASLGMADNTSTLQWNQVNGATGYKIYRNTSDSFTSGSLLRTTITNGTTVSFTDTGAATGAGLPPTAPTGTKLVFEGWQGQAGQILQIHNSGGTTGNILRVWANGQTAIATDGNLEQNSGKALNVGGGGAAIQGCTVFGPGTFGPYCNGGSIVTIRVTSGNSVGLAIMPSVDAIGQLIRGIAGQTADLFQLQDSNGLVNGAFNAAGNQLTLGRIAGSGTVTQGKLLFSDGTTSNYGVTLQSTTLTANRTITLPNEDGTICTTGSVCTGYAPSATNGYVQLAPASSQTDATTNSSIYINKTGASGNILQLQKAGVDKVVVTNGGNVGINATGANLLSVNNLTTADSLAQVAISTGATTNKGLVIQGVASQTADLFQLQDSNGLVNGAFNAAGNQLTLGRIAGSGTVTQGKLLFSDGTTSNYGLTLQSATLTGNRTITLPDQDGTVCLSTNNCTGLGAYIQNGTSLQTSANFAIQSAVTTSVTGVLRALTNQTAHLLQFQDASANVLSSFNTNGHLQIASTMTALSAPGTLTLSTLSGGGLAASTTYYYKVTAIDAAGGETAASTENNIATTGSNMTIRITWTAVTGASAYRVYRGTSAGGENVFYTTPTNSYTDSGLNASSGTPPTTGTALISGTTSSAKSQLAVGSLGTVTGQVYVSGTAPVLAASAPSVTGNASDWAGQVYSELSAGFLYTTNEVTDKFGIYDISNPLSPIGVSSTSISVLRGLSFGLKGNYAYLSTGSGLVILDISNPASPSIVTTVSSLNRLYKIRVSGNYLYAVDVSAQSKMYVVDISNPINPIVKGSITLGSSIMDLATQGRYVYTVMGQNNPDLDIIDVSNPYSPSLVGSNASNNGYFAITVRGNYAYTKWGNNGIGVDIFDVSNPAVPTLVGQVSDNNNHNDGQQVPMYIQGRYMYLSGWGSMEVVDIANPYKPIVISSTAGDHRQVLGVQGRYIYVFNYSNNTLETYDLGGAYIQQLETGGIKTSTLAVESSAVINGDTAMQGSLNVGSSAQINGTLSVTSSTYLQGALQLASGIQGGTSISMISTPGAPTITNGGTAGSTTYSYAVAAVTSSGVVTAASSAGTTNTGNATLSGSNYNIITWSPVAGAVSYKVYRTASGGTPATTGLMTTTQSLTLYDTGYAASGSVPTSSAGNLLQINSLTTADNAAQLAISTGATTNKGLVIQGVASQNANYFEVQDSTGAQLFSITKDGLYGNYGTAYLPVYTSSGNTVSCFNSAGFSINDTNACANPSIGLKVRSWQANNRAVVIVGNASQTADLIQLQDSNGLINAAFNAAGNQLTLGRIAGSGTVTQGKLLFSDGTTSNYGLTLQSATLTAIRTITLPNEDGTICTTGSVCTGYQAAPTSGSYIYQVPASTAANTITPTANSVVGLTVNGTSGTAAPAVNIVQAGGALGLGVTSSSTGDGQNIELTNTTGTQTNGLYINRNGAGGTTTNLLNLTNTAGTATNAINISGTFTNLINSTNVTVTNAGNADFAGTLTAGTGDAFQVAANGAVTAVGVNSGTGLIQGTGGLTITGATNINTSGANATNIGTGTNTGTIGIGSATAGTISIQSSGAANTTAGAASTISTSAGALTLTSAAAATWSTTAGNLTLQAGSGTVSLGTSTALTTSGALSITSGVANALSVDAGGAAALNLGITNANAVSISRTGITTTVNGVLTVSEDTNLNGNTTIGNATTDRLTVTSQILGGSPLVFQGATDNGFTTTLALTDPTANNTITLPNETGTVCTTGSVCNGYAPASGSANYIQNSTSQQSNANFNILSSGTAFSAGRLEAVANATAPVLTVRGGATPGSGGELITALDSSGNGRFIVGADGTTTINKSNAYTTAFSSTQDGDSVARFSFYASGGLEWGSGSAARDLSLFRPSAGVLRVSNAGTTSPVSLQVQASSAQGTTNLLELQDNSNNVLSLFNASGYLGIGTTSAPNKLNVNALTTADSLAQVAISTGVTTNKGLVIQGVAGQANKLLDIQNSAGSSMSYIDNNGNIQSGYIAGTYGVFVGTNLTGAFVGTNVALGIVAKDASSHPAAVIRGLNSQTADLLQLQDSNGLVNGAFNAAGNQLTLGRIAGSGTVTQGKLLFSDGSTSNYGLTLQSATLTANRTITLPNEDGTVCTTATGGACSALSFYIQNQNAGQQATSNFWISGTGRADTSFTTPLLDTSTAVALNIGTTNATQINLNQNSVVGANKNLTVDTSTLYVDGTNDRVQIGSTGAINAKLSVVGTADQTQLLIRANGTQSASSPLVLFQDSGGSELLRFTALNNSNVTIGYSAGSTASGTSSVFIGNYAGNATTGSWNTAVGSNALRLNSTGTSNTALGAGALYATTGSSNTGLGDDAGADNTSGGSNIFVGQSAGRYTRTGGYNTIVGMEAGYGVNANSFANNTLFGYRSGYALTTGSNNILLGYQAGDNLTSGANNIIIGYDINATSATGNNQLNIGNTIYGDTSVGSVLLKNTTNSTTAFLVQNSSGNNLLQIDTTNNNIYLNGLNSGQPQVGTNNSNSLTSGRTGIAAGQAYYNGYVYMLGGNNGGGVQTTVEYAKVNTDGSIGTVATSTALPVATTRGSVVTYNGYIYYIGGETVVDTTYVATVYFAKLNSNGTVGTWRTTTSLGTTRASVGAFTADGYLYVLGGRTNGSSYLTTAESAKIYADGTLGSWSAVTSLPSARAFGRATYANGFVYYVAGETTGFGYTSTVYHAPVNTDGTLGSWTTSGNSLPTAQIAGGLGVANGYLYWWGGYDGAARSSIYFAQLNADGTIGSWTTATNGLATAAGSNGYALVNGYLYTFGGFGNITTVQYSSLPRVRLSGSLDLVGGVAGNLNQSGAGGSITAGDITAVGNLNVQGSASFAQNVAISGVLTANDKARFGQLTTDDSLAQVAITTNATTAKGLVIQGVASQTADLFQAQASTGSNLFVVSSAGSVGIKTAATAPTGDLSFGVGANRTINVLTQTAANTAGNNLTVNAATGNGNGAGGNLVLQAGGGGATGVGGTTTLQGGTAGGGNTNGGNVYITGGVPAGSGSKGLVVIDTATYSTAATQSSTVDANITQSNIDGFGAIILNATAADVDFTLTSPSLGAAAAGRLVYVTAANGSNDFTLRANVGGGTGVEQNIAMRQNTTATMIWNGTQWTAAGASSSTTLQAAYDNTLSSAGGAEIVLNNSATANGLTVRNNASNPIIGGIFETQTSIGSNLFSVNNNATEYATNGGAETQGASSTTFPANTWDTTTGGTVTRYITAGDNIATGAASVSVVTTTTNHGARNRISTSLTSGLTYSVSFAVRGATNFSTLQVLYSPDGTTSGTTQCATAQTVTSGIWTRISCTFVASGTITSSNSILIRQTDATGRTFYVDNLSVNINASATYAADGSVDNAGAFATNWTDFDGGTGSTTITRDTSVIYDTSASAAGATTANANQGIRNNMAITPQTNTQYLVSFYARSTNTMTNSLAVGFLPAGGTSVPSGTAACVDYNTQSLVANTWTKITCLFTTAATSITNPDLVIYQTDATARSIYVDALSITLNTNNSNNVQIGGANKGGPATLFTLDRASSAPIAANNDAYLGSMYYDTTTGRIQCYEADGWGACGSAPDNIVNLNPEYAGAVLNGTGVGTMTADLCADQSGVLQVNASLCDGTGSPAVKATNFYRWTSPQATQQTYSIYVSYQLPTTFKSFASDDTVQLTARVDSTTNAAVTYEMFRSEGGTLYSCGTGETSVTTTANTWQTVGINGNEATGCSFTTSSANAFVIFKINVKAKSNANAYVSTLSFTTTGK